MSCKELYVAFRIYAPWQAWLWPYWIASRIFFSPCLKNRFIYIENSDMLLDRSLVIWIKKYLNINANLNLGSIIWISSNMGVWKDHHMIILASKLYYKRIMIVLFPGINWRFCLNWLQHPSINNAFVEWDEDWPDRHWNGSLVWFHNFRILTQLDLESFSR